LSDEVDTKASTTDLNNLSEIVETKANAASVIQALSTKADLVDGVIPASQLPSYVDDVLEYPTLADFPNIGESGKIYVADDTNKTYRWSGSGYVEISGGGVALGETASTAYRGDRGKVSFDHSQSQGNPHNATTSDIPEGIRLYFTDARVRSSVLSGIVFTDKSKVTAVDSVEKAIGKVQAQINDLSGLTWVDAKTIGTLGSGIDTSWTKLEFARKDGLLWLKGRVYGTHNGSTNLFVSSNSQYFLDVVAPPSSGSATCAFIGAIDAQGSQLSTFFCSQGISIAGLYINPVNNFASKYFYINPICLGELLNK